MTGIDLDENLFYENQEKIMNYLNHIQVNDKIREKYYDFYNNPKKHQSVCGVSVNIFDFMAKFSINGFKFKKGSWMSGLVSVNEVDFYKPLKELKEPKDKCDETIITNNNNSANMNKYSGVLLIFCILGIRFFRI